MASNIPIWFTTSLNNNNPPSVDIFSPVKVNSTGFMLTGSKSKSAEKKFLALQLLVESGCFVSLLLEKFVLV